MTARRLGLLATLALLVAGGAEPFAQGQLPPTSSEIRREAYRIVRTRRMTRALDPLLAPLVVQLPDPSAGPSPAKGESEGENPEDAATDFPAESPAPDPVDAEPDSGPGPAAAEAEEPGSAQPPLPGLVVLAVRDGDIIYSRAFGYADLASATPLTIETVFPIGEVGEQLAAATAVGLVEEGLIKLRDPASETLPAWQPERFHEHDPSFIELLVHTAGYAAAPILWRNGVLRGELLQAAQRARPARPAGRAYEAFRPGPMIATVAASTAAGEGWGQLLNRRILDPLGMNQTFIGPLGSRRWVAATLYRRVPASAEQIATERFPVEPEPGQGTLDLTLGLRSSGADLARWARFLVGTGEVGERVVLRPGSMRTLFARQPGNRCLAGELSERASGEALVDQRGRLGGASVHVRLLPDHNAAWVALTNTLADDLLDELAPEITAALLEDAEKAALEAELEVAPSGGTPLAGSGPLGDVPDIVRAEFVGGIGQALPGPVQMISLNGVTAIVPAGRPPIPLGPPLPDGRLPLVEGIDPNSPAARSISFVRAEGSREIRAIVVHVAGFAFHLPRLGFAGVADLPELPTELFGVYRHPHRGTVTVGGHAWRPALFTAGGFALEFDPPDENGRHVLRAQPKLSVSFERDGDGAVTGLVQHLPTGDLVYERLSEEEAARHAEEQAARRAELLEQAQERRLEQAGDATASGAESGPPEPNASGQGTPEQQGSGAPATTDAGEPGAAGTAQLDPLRLLEELRDHEGRSAALAQAGGVRLVGKAQAPDAGLSGTGTLLFEGTERFRLALDFEPFGSWALAHDGEHASETPWFAPPRSLDAAEARAVRRRHPCATFGDWNSVGDEVRFAGLTQNGTARVEVSGGDAPTLRLTVGATGDVLSAELLDSDAPRIEFEALRDIGGIRLPFRWRWEDPVLGEVVVQWSDVDAGLDLAGQFDLTAAPAVAQGTPAPPNGEDPSSGRDPSQGPLKEPPASEPSAPAVAPREEP